MWSRCRDHTVDLQATPDGLIWKLDGLSERDVRLPRAAAGNNLLGLLKHCLRDRLELTRYAIRAGLIEP